MPLHTNINGAIKGQLSAISMLYVCPFHAHCSLYGIFKMAPIHNRLSRDSNASHFPCLAFIAEIDRLDRKGEIDD